MFKEINILEPFFNEPSREFNVREFGRVMHLAPATASKYLMHFAKLRILLERSDRMLKLYKANVNNDFWCNLKVFQTIRKLYDFGVIMQINEFYHKPHIRLFGSAAYGMDNETSDIDLLAISEKTSRLKVSSSIEKKLHRTLHILACKQISDLQNEHLINNVLNGIPIQGRIKWTYQSALEKGLLRKHRLIKT